MHFPLVSTTPGALLLHSLAELSPSKRHSFYNLSYVNLPADLEPDSPAYNEQLALAIFETNSIAAGNNVGIFPRTARLNHGCSSAFNSVYTWREGEGALVVFALKSIKKGEVSILQLMTDESLLKISAISGAGTLDDLHEHKAAQGDAQVCYRSLTDELLSVSYSASGVIYSTLMVSNVSVALARYLRNNHKNPTND